MTKRSTKLKSLPLWGRLKHAKASFVGSAEMRPEEIGLSFALVFFGLRSLISGLHVTPGSIQELPNWLAFTYCALAVTGGGSVLIGVYFRRHISWAYGLEIFGLLVSSSAWSAYIFGLLLTPFKPTTTLLVTALFALVISGVVRANKIRKDNRALMSALRLAQTYKEQ